MAGRGSTGCCLAACLTLSSTEQNPRSSSFVKVQKLSALHGSQPVLVAPTLSGYSEQASLHSGRNSNRNSQGDWWLPIRDYWTDYSVRTHGFRPHRTFRLIGCTKRSSFTTLPSTACTGAASTRGITRKSRRISN